MIGLNSHRLLLCPVLLLTAFTACRSSEPDLPPVATPTVTLNHDRVPAGAVMELTYKFVVAENATFDQNHRVFVHFEDVDGDYMWGDDHDPPIPTTSWKPGQTVEYQRTLFAPVFPYVGETTMTLGLHGQDQRRLPLSGEHVGQQAYKVARFELLPQTENVFTVFKEGWHQAEAPEHDALVEWQWTKQDATLAFRNPRKDAVFYFDLDSPGSPFDAQRVTVLLGGQPVDEFAITPSERLLRRITLPAAQMGAADMVELRISVDRTFVPAQLSDNQRDQRTLGVRVFHAYVDGR